MTIKRVFLIAIPGLLWCLAAVAEPTAGLTRPAALEPDILFWTRIYTEVDTRGGLIHDNKHLGVVYEVLRFPAGTGRRTQSRLVKAAKQRYKKILLGLARGKRENLSRDEAQVLALWPQGVSNKTLKAATGRLRFQLGQSDKFRAGLARSGIWEAHIRQILTDEGLPPELVALPHVESSFNPKARSRVGASGLWQFTRSTGRRYMRIDRSVDERNDPYLSSVAAAKLLSHNYAATGAWPLAITSYNHGSAGVRRAARKLGTKDITRIVREYKSRRFGFASRNFYVAFLAAVEIHFHPDKYFDAIPRHSAPSTQLLRIPDYVSIDTLQRTLGIDRDILREHNPALLPTVWRGAKYVPRGYALRVPSSQPRAGMLAALSRISEDERHKSQLRDRYYTVRRGNTLAGIAKHFEVDIDDLVAVNDIRSRHRIRAGQVLTLPLPGGVTVDPAVRVPADRGPAGTRPAATLVAENGKYTVRRGDSVWLIARRLAVDEEILVSLNDLGDGKRIQVGQVLRVEPDKPQPIVVAAAPPDVAVEAAPGITGEAASVEAPVAESGASSETSTAIAGDDISAAAAPPPAVATASQSTPADEASEAAGETAPEVAATGGAPQGEELQAQDLRAQDPRAEALEVQALEVQALEVQALEVQALEAEALEAEALEAEALEAEAAAEVVADLLEDATPEHVSDGLIARVEQAEPASAEEAEEISPSLPLTVQPELSADPSDYSVVKDSIEVQATETLGHYADWLELRTWRLRHLNGMRYGQPVVIGQRLALDFSRVTASDFEHRRVAYHRALQESFFKRNRIAGTSAHVIRRGESLWILARRQYHIPVWLLRQYNPDMKFNAVEIGANITVPQVEPVDEEPPVATTTTAKAG